MVEFDPPFFGATTLGKIRSPYLSTCSYYPLFVLTAFLAPLLYMHRSKIGARSLQLQTPTEIFAYYHADLLFFGLLALFLFLMQPMRRFSLIVLAAFYYLALADWISWHTQYKSFMFGDLYRALQLLIYYPEFAENLPARFKIKAGVLFAFPIGLAAILRVSLAQKLQARTNKALQIASFTTVALCITPTPWLISSSYTNNNSILFMLSEQMHALQLESIEATRQSMAQTLGHGTNQRNAVSHPTIKQANIVIFVIETAPYPEYPDLNQLISELRNPWLAKHSIIFNQHYSTYPGSDRANYSINSGLYPPMVHHNNWKGVMHYGDSLPRALSEHGYATFLFSTAPLSFYDDDLMYKRIGFDALIDVEETKALRKQTDKGFEWDKMGLYKMDDKLIDIAIETLRAHVETQPNTPFFANISPQSSHAPFHCPPETQNIGTLCHDDPAKIRTNAAWQFALIERVIDALDDLKKLDETVLIITGDHGIRSKHESSLFSNANVLQKLTFNVPFILAVGNEIHELRSFDYPTSHIDIAPTVLDIAEIPRKRYYFHGINMFTPPSRSIYFIGNGYLPVNGFLKDDRFYMENRTNQILLSSPTMVFEQSAEQTMDESGKSYIQHELIKLEAFLDREYRPPILQKP